MTASEIITAPRPLVLEFHEGDRTMAELLGGKGAGLAEMTRLGLPVPPGFIVTTEACRAFLAAGGDPEGLWDQVDAALADLEQRSGLALGDPERPLLVSVRSGAKFSMPGMMETVLNIGLNDEVVAALAERGEAHFAWDSYRRLGQMYGRTVLGVDGSLFDDLLTQARAARPESPTTPSSTRLTSSASHTDFRAIIVEQTGKDLPAGCARAAASRRSRAVFALLERRTRPPLPGPRAHRRRPRHGGQRRPDGLRQPRRPLRQRRLLHPRPRDRSARRLRRLPARRPGRGRRQRRAQPDGPVGAAAARPGDPRRAVAAPAHALEQHYRDLCDVEFTVERGRLWILQTRLGKRSPAAAFRIAVELVDDGRHRPRRGADPRRRRPADRPCCTRRSRRRRGRPRWRHGLAASPGAAVGQLVFNAATAMEWAALGAERRPRPARDEPRRLRRHARRPGGHHLTRRADLARGGRRPRSRQAPA